MIALCPSTTRQPSSLRTWTKPPRARPEPARWDLVPICRWLYYLADLNRPRWRPAVDYSIGRGVGGCRAALPRLALPPHMSRQVFSVLMNHRAEKIKKHHVLDQNGVGRGRLQR